ncbi:MAG TPA: PIN domain-containing protein, partial [Coxiellaceae bacterium]|nr:PIN domain-containing protein [Coxiellaceae bacterium]
IDITRQSGFLELPVTMRHAMEVYNLPNLHRDPFDHILLAQAVSEPLRLLTADSKLKQYSEIVELI